MNPKIVSLILTMYATLTFIDIITGVFTISSKYGTITVYQIVNPAIIGVLNLLFGTIVLWTTRTTVALASSILGALGFLFSSIIDATIFGLAIACYNGDGDDIQAIYASYMAITFIGFASSLSTLIWVYYSVLMHYSDRNDG